MQHVEWGPRLATLVDAGWYEVLEGEEAVQAATADLEPPDASQPTRAPTKDADGDGKTRRARR
ncbi:hypothetical protein ABZ436_32390 [Micromonospora matsumotoense]|uniref:hypothetical protein n=1 Tax=Micromonospora matsumotoense TaxID=121616 RepID=UPI0033F2E737